MPRKKKQPEGLDRYDLPDVFKREASDGVEVRLEDADPGHALVCRAYTGDAAHSILKQLDERYVFSAEDGELDESIRRGLIEECARKALEIFEWQLRTKLREALEELKQEAITQAMRDMGFNELSHTAGVNALLRVGDEWKKRRFETRTPGRAPEWHPVTRAMLLFHYEEALAAVREARKIFRARRRGVDWREAVRDACPDMPDEVLGEIEHLEIKKSEVARKWAAAQMGVTDSEYLNKVLALARREGEPLPPGYPDGRGLET
jgi:hypothetical protein